MDNQITILAADDQLAIRRLIQVVLGDTYRLDVTEDGKAAYQKAAAQRKPYDLILTDYHMPNMDGLALINRLRKLEAYRFTPILVISTDSDGEKKRNARAAGANGWIMKPFTSESLLKAVTSMTAN